MEPITDKEKQSFEFLKHNIEHCAIVRSSFQGKDVLVIVDIVEEDGQYLIFPMWMMVTPEIMDQLMDPAEVLNDTK